MPSGRQHRKLASATAPLVVLGAWTIAGFPVWDAVWLDIGIVLLGYLINPSMLSPDMDLVHSDPSDVYGKAEPLWWGYQALIHRGPLSHLPPLSSILRVLYLWAALAAVGLFGVGILDLVWYGLFNETPISVELVKITLGYWGTVFVFPQFWFFLWGVSLGDVIHTGADWAFSYMKK